MDNAKKKNQPKKQNKPTNKKNNDINEEIFHLLKSTPKPLTTMSCVMCGNTSENTQIFTSSCTYHHDFCFNCIFKFYFLNISECLNCELNKYEVTLQCPMCANRTESGKISFDLNDFLTLLKFYYKKFPTNYTKKLPPCPLHKQLFTLYCNNCNQYFCELCKNNHSKDHNLVSIKDKENELKEKIKNIPLKVKNFNDKFIPLVEKNTNNYQSIYNKTLAEIDKLIQSLQNLKTVFVRQMENNLSHFESYSKIISETYNGFYSQIKSIKCPISDDYGIPHLKFLNEVVEELHGIKLTINPSVFQEVELCKKKIEGLLSDIKITSTIKFNSTFDKVREYKCTKTIKEHTNIIRKMIINTETQKVFTCSDDKLIKVYDFKNDSKVQNLKGHGEAINCMILMTKTKIATGSDDKLIKIWESKGSEYKCVSTLKGHTSGVLFVVSITNEDGTPTNRLASASSDNTIRVWEPKGDYKNSTLIDNHGSKITALIYVGKEIIAASSEDCTIKLYDTKNKNNCIYIIKEHTEKINELMFLDAKEILLSCADDCTIISLNAKEEYKLVNRMKEHTMAVTMIKMISDSVFGSISKDKRLKLWDIDNEYKCLCTIEVHKWEVLNFCICFNKKIIYTASQDKTIKAVKILNWDEYSSDKRKSLIWRCTSTLKGHERDVTFVDMLDDDTVISYGNDYLIKLWKEE